MIHQGKSTSARIFADMVEDAAMQWLQTICDHPAMIGVPVVQMPDVHAGASCNIGTAYPVMQFLSPAHVGVDIGCMVSAHRLSATLPAESYPLLDHRISESVPMGSEICLRNSLKEKDLFRFLSTHYRKARSLAPDLIDDQPRIDARFISDLCRRIRMQEGIFYKSLGTLGGGNHFIEYGEDTASGEGWLTIHCGSRNLGSKVAAYWQKIAGNAKRGQYVGYLRGDALRGYLSDMVVAQAYAAYNHIVIRDRIFNILRKLCRAKCVESIFTPHNYVGIESDMIMLRKGAIDASEGCRCVIPFNMRDGIAICVGKGNGEWLCSAPHGAGRAMSRAQAEKQISLADFRQAMEGIYSTSVCESTVDESPMAYKPAQTIIDAIAPTVDIISFIKPRVNIKSIQK